MSAGAVEAGARRRRALWPALLAGLAASVAGAAAVGAGLVWFAVVLPPSNPLAFAAGAWGHAVIYAAVIATLVWAAVYARLSERMSAPLGFGALLAFFAAAFLTCAGFAEFGTGKLNRMLVGEQVQAATKYYFTAVEDDMWRYDREVGPVRFKKILGPKALMADKDLSQAVARLARARGIIERYRQIELSRQAQARHMVETAHASAAVRKAALAEFDRRFGEIRPLMAEYWEIERASVIEVSGVVKLLSDARGHWTVDKRGVTFERPEDFRKLEVRSGNLDRLQSESDEMRCALRNVTGGDCVMFKDGRPVRPRTTLGA